MPKQKEKLSEFLSRVTKEYTGVFRTDGSILYCVYCSAAINSARMFNVKQHISSVKHQEAAKKRTNNNAAQQILLNECSNKSKNKFTMDLCKAFIEANVPLKKIRHPSINKFLSTYTQNHIACETTLRAYIPNLYKEKINFMQEKARNKYIWTSLDETTDAEQRYIANFVFGILDSEEESTTCYLLNIAELKEVNASTIAAFYADSLQILWPDGIQYGNVLLCVTDAASYMMSAMKALQTLYPKMLHLTCFAHGLHRVAEFVRSEFSLVNSLISNVKAVFIKSASRKKKFKEMYPDLNLPPKPIITRWGTWIDAAVYYCDNFLEVKQVLDELDDNDSEAIREAKKLFLNSNLKNQLAFIKTSFQCIALSIVKLETRRLSLNESLQIIKRVRETMKNLENNKYIGKMNAVFARNKGYAHLVEIGDIIYTNKNSEDLFVKKLSPNDLTMFKFVPTTSFDVERVFSVYKTFLPEQRRNFIVENLKMNLIVHCNAQE